MPTTELSDTEAASPWDGSWLQSIGFGVETINGWSILLPVHPTAHPKSAITELWVNHDGNVSLMQGTPTEPNCSDDLIALTSLAPLVTRGDVARLLTVLGGWKGGTNE